MLRGRRDQAAAAPRGWRLGCLVAIAFAFVVTAAVPAAAQSPEPFGPYDGSIPFNCELQYLGTGTDYPDPDADPMCVEFDKTNQNVTDFGIVEFLSKEPDRVAAAAPKCFYFQRDHWTGSVEQGQQPELWHWDGNYFYDRALGIGGVNVRNARIGSQPMDGSQWAPPQYKPFFEQGGGGGMLIEMESEPDPSCAAKVDTPEERRKVYSGYPRYPRCIDPGGDLRGRRVGPVRLGMTRERVLRELGAPRNHKHGADRWCLVGKGQLRILYGGGHAAKGRGAVLIRTSGRGHSAHRVARGDRKVRAFRRLDLRRLFRLRQTRVFEARHEGARRLLVGISAHRVRWLALADPRALDSGRDLRRALRRAR